VTHDDTRVLGAAGKPRYERIAAAVTDDFMPPLWLKLEPEVVPLTDAERSTLLGWCESGAPEAPADDPECEGP
jgi:hypothetical protein